MLPVKDTIYSRSFPLVTWGIIIANTLAFLLELSLGEEKINEFFYLYGLVPARYSHPLWTEITGISSNTLLPFVTNTFLHNGWAHFLGNMWTLYIFGDNVEDKMGSFRYFIFYLSCGILASSAHYFTNVNSTIPAIGASGAISGVMGAYMFLFPRSKIIFFIPLIVIPFFFELSAFFYLGFWFAGQLLSGTFENIYSTESGGIAFWAHIGGFISGAVLYKLFIRDNRKRHFHDNYWINNLGDRRRY
jgi:membrane associated rhomboid family serine protease